MKRDAKRLGTALSAALMAALCADLLLFAGCKDLFHPEGPDDEPATYTVTFYTSGGTPSTQTKTVTSGGSVGSSNMPDDPVWDESYAFDGWYTERSGGGSRFTHSTTVSSNITVYAKWTAAPTVSDPYYLTRSAINPDIYYFIPDDFLPDGFTVSTGDQIEVSFLMKTDTDIENFTVGLADWANGGGWIATDWTAFKSVRADGRFHRVIWTLTAQGSGPVGSSPLIIQFSMDPASVPTVTILVSDVSVTKTSLPLVESLARIRDSAVEGGVYTISLSTNETIAPQTLSYNGKNVSVTLASGVSEQTIRLSGTGVLFTVGSGVTLTLDSNVTLVGRSSNTSALVRVDSGGTLEMNAGSKISGNSNSSGSGGGVYVDSNGAFDMSGGTISDNTALSGGGVYVWGGAFDMSGGTISGNTATTGFGGGVYVLGGPFTKQSGGVIYGSNADSGLKNTATSGDSYGHAVYVASGSRKRNSTAGTDVPLDSAKSGVDNGWE